MYRNKISNESFQIIFFKWMNSQNLGVVYCSEDDEYRVYCDICDKLCIETFYKKHLKTGTHTNNIRKREQLLKWFQIILYY